MSPARKRRGDASSRGWEGDDAPAPVEVGAVIIDRWKGNRTWNVYNFEHAPRHIGGWHAKLLDEDTGPRDENGRPASIAEANR